ncbi:response regulator [Tundrisphaera sp. TA3]|uniref:response regulator n=1 Tax=Tundrisphaera sp. TA3 TaxID=3435775 RepID=UPI003EB6D8ED
MGIGLTVVKKLVEMHGGTIAARSDGPGLGSEFLIRLPRAGAPSVESARPKRPESEPARKLKILIVDDNVDTARGMARLMKLLGHEVATAHDGLEAIEVARQFLPRFIMLDIGLPGMSGYEVAAKLRREPCGSDALIVAVSGYGQDEDRRRSREAGFDYHLTKPVDHDALLQLLANGADATA